MSVCTPAGRRCVPALARVPDPQALHRPASRLGPRAADGGPGPGAGEDQIDELTDAFAVHEALAELPENCREILDRFFARDESYRTIGQALDLPSGTIASRISRCLTRLREQLGEEMTAGRRLEVDESSS